MSNAPSELHFTNSGEIDMRLVTILGTNVKETKSPIGQFGTGLKYAIAVTLRLGGTVTIYSGTERHKFTADNTEIRGKQFGLIYMNSQDLMDTTGASITCRELGFTTDLGKHWVSWMACREFYCNCLDENGVVTVQDKDTVPELLAGHTTVVVQCDELLDAYKHRSVWHIDNDERPIYADESIQIYANRGDRSYFYRGIKVGETSVKSLYTYNMIRAITLTEDRTLDQYHVKQTLIDTVLYRMQDESIMEKLLTVSDSNWEYDARFYIFHSPSPTVIKVAENLMTNSLSKINPNFLSNIVNYLPKPEPKPISLTQVQTLSLQKAREFLAAFGYNINYDIVVVETLGDNKIVGLANRQDRTIYLPLRIFDRGTKYIASTLLEEYLHLSEGFEDESREFQDYLLERLVSMMEEATGRPL